MVAAVVQGLLLIVLYDPLSLSIFSESLVYIAYRIDADIPKGAKGPAKTWRESHIYDQGGVAGWGF